MGRRMDEAWKRAISEGLKARRGAGKSIESAGVRVANKKTKNKLVHRLIGGGNATAGARIGFSVGAYPGSLVGYAATRNARGVIKGANIGRLAGGAIGGYLGSKLDGRAKPFNKIGKKMQKIGKRMQK